MKLVAHHSLKSGIYLVASAMTGMELRLGIGFHKSLGQGCELVLRLMSVQQMESTDNRFDWPRTRCKNIFQTTMGATCEEQTFCVKNKFVTEIIKNILLL